MKNLKNKIIIGIAILIFVVGIIVVAVKGFNVDLEYQDTKKIEANIGKSFEKEMESSKIYAYSASIFALISCAIAIVTMFIR